MRWSWGRRQAHQKERWRCRLCKDRCSLRHTRVGPGASLPLVRLGGGGGEARQILPLGAQHLFSRPGGNSRVGSALLRRSSSLQHPLRSGSVDERPFVRDHAAVPALRPTDCADRPDKSVQSPSHCRRASSTALPGCRRRLLADWFCFSGCLCCDPQMRVCLPGCCMQASATASPGRRRRP